MEIDCTKHFNNSARMTCKRFLLFKEMSNVFMAICMLSFINDFLNNIYISVAPNLNECMLVS